MFAKRAIVARCLFLFLGLAYAGLSPAAPQIQHWETGNGARVFFVPAPELPMVDIRVTFDAGSARDGHQAGLAQLTNSLLNEGAGNLSADDIAERFESVGAQFGTSALRDMAVVSLRSLTEPKLLQPAVDTLAQVLRNPTFPDANLERERKRVLVGLQAQQQSPGEIASKAYYAALYGDHPYASPPLGTEASVSAIKREDIVAFHTRYYGGRNAVVVIIGAVNSDTAHQLAEQVVGGLPAGEQAPALPVADTLITARTMHIDYPSAQTHVLMGQPGISRDDPDYFPLYVGNHILGGGSMVSRINEEVREKRGLSYSAYSFFTPMRMAGPFTAGLQTRNDQAEHALKVMNETIAGFLQDGPTAKELEAAKQNITGGFALRLDSNAKIGENVAMIAFYGLPLDYLDTFKTKVVAVTASQVRDAFQRRVHLDRMVTVIVGGAAEDAAGTAAP